MTRRLLPLVALLVTAAGLPGQAAAATTRAAYGVQGVDTFPTAKPTDISRAISAARRSRARLIRLEGSWAALQPQGPGAYDATALAALDRAVAAAKAARLRVVLFVDRTPCWASSAPPAVRGSCAGAGATRAAVYRYPPVRPSDYVPVSSFLARRYGSTLTAFEIWNEPDQANEKYWAGPDKVARYVALVQAAYRPLKQANPKLQVLAGSFVGGDGRWLKAMYQQGVRGSYDGLAVHFYDLPLASLKTTRAVQRAAGDTKPLWLTEFGWTSCYRRGGPVIEIDQRCVTRTAQRENTRDLLASLRLMPWVRAAIQYELFDHRGGYHFGLFDTAGKAKPVLAVAASYARGRTARAGRPTIAAARRGGRITLGGHASGADVLTLKVRQGSRLLFVATLRADPANRWSLRLPSALSVRGLRATINGLFTGSATSRT